MKLKEQKSNIVSIGMPKDELENTLSWIENITKLFEDCFVMRDATVYAAHRVGKKRLELLFVQSKMNAKELSSEIEVGCISRVQVSL